MSSICIGVIQPVVQEDFGKKLAEVAGRYGRGITFEIGWHEPVLDSLTGKVFVFSLFDYPGSENCEMLLLPDGCFLNGETNNISFRERMELLRDLAGIVLENGSSMEYYIGLSGTLPEEYDTEIVNIADLPQRLEERMDPIEAVYAIHLIVR